MRKGISLFIVLLIAGCSAPNSIRYSARPTLMHTYSVCILPEDDGSKRFVELLKEELIWEQYLYIAASCSDADTIMKVKVKRKGKGKLIINISYSEKATGNKWVQNIEARINQGDPISTVAKLLAHHLHEMLVLPPEVEAATPYGDAGDPGGEAAK